MTQEMIARNDLRERMIGAIKWLVRQSEMNGRQPCPVTVRGESEAADALLSLFDQALENSGRWEHLRNAFSNDSRVVVMIDGHRQDGEELEEFVDAEIAQLTAIKGNDSYETDH